MKKTISILFFVFVFNIASITAADWTINRIKGTTQDGRRVSCGEKNTINATYGEVFYFDNQVKNNVNLDLLIKNMKEEYLVEKDGLFFYAKGTRLMKYRVKFLPKNGKIVLDTSFFKELSERKFILEFTFETGTKVYRSTQVFLKLRKQQVIPVVRMKKYEPTYKYNPRLKRSREKYESNAYNQASIGFLLTKDAGLGLSTKFVHASKKFLGNTDLMYLTEPDDGECYEMNRNLFDMDLSFSYRIGNIHTGIGGGYISFTEDRGPDFSNYYDCGWLKKREFGFGEVEIGLSSVSKKTVAHVSFLCGFYSTEGKTTWDPDVDPRFSECRSSGFYMGAKGGLILNSKLVNASLNLSYRLFDEKEKFIKGEASLGFKAFKDAVLGVNIRYFDNSLMKRFISAGLGVKYTF